MDEGYWQASRALLEETQLDAGAWSVAANVDLGLILRDFQEYFELRYDRKVVIAARREGSQALSGAAKTLSAKKSAKPSKRRSSRQLPKIRVPGAEKENRTDNFQIEGQKLGAAPQKEPKDPLKGLPRQYLACPELRALAEQVRRDIVRDAAKVGFGDVVGLAGAKRLLREAIWLPQAAPEIFASGRRGSDRRDSGAVERRAAVWTARDRENAIGAGVCVGERGDVLQHFGELDNFEVPRLR